MKKLSILLLISVFAIYSCKEEKKEPVQLTTLSLGDFELSTDKIIQNTPFTITYNGNDSKMVSFYHQLNNFKAYPYDINFTNNKATITIPDSISVIAFNFHINDKYDDNNEKGYILNVHDVDGNIIKGSNTTASYYPMNIGKQYGLKADKIAFLDAMQTDLDANPELKEIWGDNYINHLYRNDKAKAKPIVEAKIKELELKEERTEKEYVLLSNLYRMLRKTELHDSINKIAIKKFPKGKIKVGEIIKGFFKTKDLVEKEKLFTELNAIDSKNASLSYLIRMLASMNFKAGNKEAFTNYANMIAKPSDKAGLYNSIAWPLVEEGKDLEFAAKLSKSSLDLLKKAEENTSNKPKYFTPNQYKKNLKATYNMYADTYAFILFKQGNITEAIKHQEIAVNEGKDPEINERYIEFLVANKQYKLASTKANAFLEAGKGTKKMKENYKKAYLQDNPDGDFNSIIADIEHNAHEKELANLKKTMLDEEAPDFALKNLNGETITLASLKGKTVILDFWATWCGPCKASFPGMQQVVEKYKDNKNVVLLFIDTMEDGKDREKTVSSFIAKNKYDFNVLYDTKNKETEQFDVASNYKVDGIPTKIIIGPSGKINFKSVGYGGQQEKLIKEIDLMVSLLNP